MGEFKLPSNTTLDNFITRLLNCDPLRDLEMTCAVKVTYIVTNGDGAVLFQTDQFAYPHRLTKVHDAIDRHADITDELNYPPGTWTTTDYSAASLSFVPRRNMTLALQFR